MKLIFKNMINFKIILIKQKIQEYKQMKMERKLFKQEQFIKKMVKQQV